MSVSLEGPDGRGFNDQPADRPAAQPAAAPVAVAQTPSQRIIGAAGQLDRVTDSTGRVLAWRQLDALDDFDLSEIAGGTNVANAKWMIYATIAFAVREIDGSPVARPINKQQLRARIAQLGSHGIDAVFQRIMPPLPDQDADDVPLVQPAQPDALPPGLERAKN